MRLHTSRAWNAAPPRQRYIIVRLDRTLVPVVATWVAHGETGPHDLVLRFTNFLGSATEYSSKRAAISEARRLAPIFNSYHFKVNTSQSRTTVWESK